MSRKEETRDWFGSPRARLLRSTSAIYREIRRKEGNDFSVKLSGIYGACDMEETVTARRSDGFAAMAFFRKRADQLTSHYRQLTCSFIVLDAQLASNNLRERNDSRDSLLRRKEDLHERCMIRFFVSFGIAGRSSDHPNLATASSFRGRSRARVIQVEAERSTLS